jgi:ABC-2 type transport system ATP-binding protein
MIHAQNLRKTFGDFLAVDDLSLRVERGEVLGFLGPNGAGKSTTMKMLTGYLLPDAGQITIGDVDIAVSPRRAQSLIGYLPEGAPAWPEMTARAFLQFIAQIRKLSGKQADQALSRAITITELQPVLDQPIETLSKGFRRRVGLAQAILHDPAILIMDEPTDGLDPNQKFHVREAIREMAENKAIIISTHILEEVDAICSRAMIIDHGQVVANGTPHSLAAQSMYHGAVTVTLNAAHAEPVRLALREWTEVSHFEEMARGDEMSITVFPVATKSTDLLNRIQTQDGWAVNSVSLELGRLDDVFRRLTHSGATSDMGLADQ